MFKSQEKDSMAGGWGMGERMGVGNGEGGSEAYGGAGCLQSAVGSSGER